VLAALRATEAAARIEALIALESEAACIDAEICAVLIALVGDEHKEIRRRAAQTLSRTVGDPQCRALLDRALTDEDARRRWGVCFALACAGVLDRAVVGVALEALGVEDGDVRWAAAEIVCRAARTDPDVITSVRAVARHGMHEQRKMALYCLRDSGVVDEFAFLGSLNDANRGVRMAALAGLGRCVSNAATEAMLSVMERDEDDGVRRAAAATLVRRGGLDATQHEKIARSARASSSTGASRSLKPVAAPKRHR
jgi:HEAT repeat protein